jgi:NDP-sugar pyrophosphorylase family protein
MDKKNKIAAIILCGGKGTRLGLKFKNTNKSLIKIKGKTLVSRNINYLIKNQINKIFVLTGHAHQKVEKEVIKNFKKKIFLNFTGINSSIVKRISKTIKFIDTFDYILIMNGDSLYKFNLKKIIKKTFLKDIDCSFVSTAKIIKYGFLKVKQNNKIVSFVKNQRFDTFSNSSNHLFYTGMCLIKKNLLKKNIKSIKKDFEIELFNKIIKKNKVKVFLDKGEFKDFNHIEDIKDLKISF